MTLTSDELTGLLDQLLAGWENEVVEFKEAAHQFSADKTGEYVSALSNEANLRGLASGWLVFGISNARQVVGTSHLLEVQQRQALKHHIHVEAMTELNLIDQMGYGIHRMVQDQVRRFLPLPDYDLSTTGEVKLTIPGAVIDESYSQLLMVRTDLPLEDVLALDRVQKGLEISEKAARHLRRVGLIEGRKPHRRITPRVAAATGAMADYIRTRPQADAHYAALLADFLRVQGHANRSDVEALLRPALSEALTEQQKATKITNLLTKLRRHGVIVNRGTRTKPRWELSYAGDEGVQSEPPRKKDDDASGTARGPGSV